jgi:hypothetical protein
MDLFDLQRIAFVGILVALYQFKEQNINLNLCHS